MLIKKQNKFIIYLWALLSNRTENLKSICRTITKKNLKNEVEAIRLTNRDKDYIPPVLSVED